MNSRRGYLFSCDGMIGWHYRCNRLLSIGVQANDQAIML